MEKRIRLHSDKSADSVHQYLYLYPFFRLMPDDRQQIFGALSVPHIKGAEYDTGFRPVYQPYAVFQGAFLYRIQCQRPDVCRYRVTRGMHAYLILGGISLFVAWLPDILSSLASGTSLALIEVYTTEITNVLDMGIISPLLFLTLALVKNHCFMGYVLLRMALRVCMGVGIMLPVQTVCQLLAGIVLPLPALITKVGIFVLLAGASFWLERCLRRATVYLE